MEELAYPTVRQHKLRGRYRLYTGPQLPSHTQQQSGGAQGHVYSQQVRNLSLQKLTEVYQNYTRKFITCYSTLQLFTPTGVKLLKLHLSYHYNAKMYGCMQFSSTIGTS